MRKDSCYTKFDWLDIFPGPIKFCVTSRIHIFYVLKKVYLVKPTIKILLKQLDFSLSISMR